MADIRRFLFIRHLRSEASSHVLHYTKGRPVHTGPGVSFWFLALSASISELPMDDRDLSILFHGRSRDFQDVTIQAVVTWRVTDPVVLSQRIDFSIDLDSGAWVGQPLEQLTQLLTQLAQQSAWEYLARTPLEEILLEGLDTIRDRIRAGLVDDPSVRAMGIEIVSVRLASVRPVSDVEKALQTPTREAIQQESDRAMFERRALAVERERAIAENELQNQIELAKREETLIQQRGVNDKRRVRQEAESAQIAADAQAARAAVEHGSQADGIRIVEEARVQAESNRIDIYRDLPSSVLVGLAARDLADNLPPIEHLVVSPELLGPALTKLAEAGARTLEAR